MKKNILLLSTLILTCIVIAGFHSNTKLLDAASPSNNSSKLKTSTTNSPSQKPLVSIEGDNIHNTKNISPKSGNVPVREAYEGLTDTTKGESGFKWEPAGEYGRVTVYLKDGTTVIRNCIYNDNGTCLIRN